MNQRLFAVVTSIQRPTPAMERWPEVLQSVNAPLFVIGDRKGPDTFELPGAQLITLAAQQAGPFRLGQSAPSGHYARKNIGYLVAIARGATCIYETDDDNAPLSTWAARSRDVEALVSPEDRWINIYKYFTDALIWPRGFPIDLIHRPVTSMRGQTALVTSSIQQGLANGSPDVDAIWRLVLDRHFDFSSGTSVSLPVGSFCPFNSQSTWWWTPAFPLMYLPSYCSFRMTDIWRGLVAQRCLWEIGERLVFHGPEVVQARNEHCLLSDFREEVPGYLANGEIAGLLLSISLRAGPEQVSANLLRCYEALVSAKHGKASPGPVPRATTARRRSPPTRPPWAA